MRLEHAVGSTWNKVRRNPQLHAALSSAERLARVKRFRDEVLLDTCHERVRLLHYEDYIRLLQDSSDADANELGTFLHHRIAAEIMD
jgi:hypothetical protein